MRTSSDRPGGVTAASFRAGTAVLGRGRASGGATLGGEGAALRQPGGRWRPRGLRDWRLRTKLTAVLLVPLVLAGVLGTLRVTDLVREARDLAALASQVGFARQVSLAVHDLQTERHLAASMLVTGRTADGAAVQAQIQRVDAAVTILRTADVGAFQAADGGQLAAAYRTALDRLAGLASLRQATVGINATAPTTIAAYSDLIAALLDLDRSVLDDASEPLARQATELKVLAVAKEQASQQHAVLLTGILSGALLPDQQALLRTVEARFSAAVEGLPPSQRDLYSTIGVAADRQRLLEATLDRATRKASLETVPDEWNSAAVGTVEAIRQGETSLLNELQADTTARSDRAWSQALWQGAVVAALLVLAVLTLVVVVRSLLKPLRTLRTAAFDVADRRLPEAVEQLQSTDGTAAHTTVDPVPVHSREEVGQVARAVDTVHAQAVRLAAEQAVARNSLNDIFLDLSGRNHGLLDRQRQLIDELRARQHDPELSSSLFQLDHLAARMRRHSENLLVLAGGNLGRGIGQHVAVLEIMRSAISEVEQHQQVIIRRVPAALVAGPVVNDLVHLIAELLDNATRVASAETPVELASEFTEDEGLLVEIIDSGPGLLPDELQAINGRLASASAVDASVSRQMGLFVVSTLAAQHGITVRLRQRPGGTGITATVALPSSLVSVDLRGPIDTGPIDTGPIDTGPIDTGPATGPIGAEPGGVGPGGAEPADTDSRISEAPAGTNWTGTEGQLPLQVSVIDEASAADLFSPASTGIVTSQYGRTRTAEEEWQELFGYQASQSEPPLTPAAPVPRQLASSPPPAGTAAAGRPPEVHEEIFEAVSAWFRERQSALASSQQLGDTTEMPVLRDGYPDPVTPTANGAHEWRSPLDEAWQVAQALRTPVDHGVTRAGLPKRRPRAQLVPGADGGGRVSTPSPVGPARTPENVRGRLSRYQRGLRVGRHARIGPDEQLSFTDTPQGHFEEDQQ